MLKVPLVKYESVVNKKTSKANDLASNVHTAALKSRTPSRPATSKRM